MKKSDWYIVSGTSIGWTQNFKAERDSGSGLRAGITAA